MELPILAPAPVLMDHAGVFRDLCDHQCQFHHCQHDLMGLIVLPNKSLAHMTRCILESAHNTTLSRVLSEAPWWEVVINHRHDHHGDGTYPLAHHPVISFFVSGRVPFPWGCACIAAMRN